MIGLVQWSCNKNNVKGKNYERKENIIMMNEEVDKTS